MEKRNEYGNGPRWIKAKFQSRCGCGRTIAPGHRIFYYPSAGQGKRVVCEECGRKNKVQFIRDAIRAICKAF